MPDRSTLALRVGGKDGALTWRLDGGLVLADDIEAYLRDVLEDLGKPQVARCGQRVRSARPDDRIECQLQNGGKAFVLVHADGSTSIEILLDPVAGDARAEVLTIEREQSLLEMSRKLGNTDDDDAE